MLLEAILKHSQRAGLVEEANALEQVRPYLNREKLLTPEVLLEDRQLNITIPSHPSHPSTYNIEDELS